VDWPVAVSFLCGVTACVSLPWPAAATAMGALLVASASWPLQPHPGDVGRMVLTACIPFVGFGVGGALFLTYLRALVRVADERADRIRTLESERTRRVLHTPYRLLGDLADLLGRQLASGEVRGSAARQVQQARLAEALASVHEIEAIVRGTEPASTNLAADLLRLREQFIDLPLILDVDAVEVDLPASVVYRVREAVRSALQNVRLHAGAAEVVVHAEAGDRRWYVSVHDDGRGFDVTTARRGVGVHDTINGAMAEIGAQVRMTSSPDDGTLVELEGVVLPVIDLTAVTRRPAARTGRVGSGQPQTSR
jgi:signal transduction histidine kinase